MSVGAGSVRSLDALSIIDGRLYWIEGRPEGDVLVCRGEGRTRDVLPAGVHVGSTVHEYGGGAYLAHRGGLWFVRADDQRIWRAANGVLHPRTPLPEHGEHRHADLQVTPNGAVICVRERHTSDEVVNELVFVPRDGSTESRVIAHGWDFYSSPRLDPDGSRLAWVTWSNPLMPWDGSWLWVADIDPDGHLGTPMLVAGGADESVTQPLWSPDGVLHYLTDRSGWWNLERHHHGRREPVISLDAELGPAPWEFGYSSYRFLDDGRIAIVVQDGCQTWLGTARADDADRVDPVPLPYTWIKPYLATDGRRIAIIGATPTRPPCVALIDPDTASTQELTPTGPPTRSVGRPERICVTTRSGSRVHGLLHPATSPGGTSALGPPLLVRPHPGPTANAQLRADAWSEFFTSHGFAVLDIDYSGSTGYGRAFRNSLRGNWGVLDVSDCVDTVAQLVADGRADPTRVAICGCSAGGFTALRAVATTDVFAAAAVRHAVIDPEGWRQAAPKFQAHHAELLLPPPSMPETYPHRSMLANTDAITAPVLIIHGERDTITPIGQARQLADTLGDRATLITFTDEGHGIRNADNESCALHAELRHLQRAMPL
ncbi:MAG: S9 family peptidase [Pseudonocardia sp.]